MPEGFHSATSQVKVSSLFQATTDMTEVDQCRNVLGFFLSSYGRNPLSHEQLMKIADDAKEVAWSLLYDQVYSGYASELQTETLLNSIKADARNGVRIYSDARSPRGYPYAGSIEYGFHPWGHDTYIPPRPFLRPALEFAINATRASWENNVKHMVQALKTNQLNLSHFSYDKQRLGASRRTWSQHLTSHVTYDSTAAMRSASMTGISRGNYSYAKSSARYGIQRGAYKGIWDIKSR